MSYRASRSKLLEAVRTWKESDMGKYFYRSVDERVDSESPVLAPWLAGTAEVSESSEFTGPTILSRWLEEDADSFGDYAESIDPQTFVDLIESLGIGTEAVLDSIVEQLESNEGSVLLIAIEGSASGYALGMQEGELFASEIDIDEDFLDEGLISMALLAQTTGDPNTPLVPDFPLIESQNNLYETLHSTVVLLNSIRESESVDPEFVAVVENFAEDLAGVIAELSCDESTLNESELGMLLETFAGVFAGLHEEAALAFTSVTE
jgi:hypothetical protein